MTVAVMLAPASDLDWQPGDAAAAVALADALGVDALDLAAIWYSESGLNPHARGGLAQMTPIVEIEMGWRPGTIAQVAGGPVLGQIGALAAFYDHLARRYARRPFASIARAWGVPPAAVLYAFAGWPTRAAAATSSASELARGGQGYRGNRHVDANNDGAITVSDVAARIAVSRDRMYGDPRAAAVAAMIETARKVPQRASLREQLAPIAPALARLFG